MLKIKKLYASVCDVAMVTRTEGSPGDGGDYARQLGNFIFTPGSRQSCLDVFVFRDSLFELTEDFTVRVEGFINSAGAQLPSLSGVTVDPETTVVQIGDANCRFFVNINQYNKFIAIFIIIIMKGHNRNKAPLDSNCNFSFHIN